MTDEHEFDRKRDGLLIGRVTIEKYATQDDILLFVDQDNGGGDDLPLIDAMGMVAFAQGHLIQAMTGVDDEDAG